MPVRLFFWLCAVCSLLDSKRTMGNSYLTWLVPWMHRTYSGQLKSFLAVAYYLLRARRVESLPCWVKPSPKFPVDTIKCIMQRAQAIKQNTPSAARLLRCAFWSSSGNGTGWAIIQQADLGLWPRSSHTGMHIWSTILLYFLIITGAMCDIADLNNCESNDVPHDVHQPCRERVDHKKMLSVFALLCFVSPDIFSTLYLSCPWKSENT